ncbi:MAG TPA: glucose-1-phosphate adenylyltransferase, partial [bacterium]|nr:glucose-1-phosphate adenylyltransferase [bacterium]
NVKPIFNLYNYQWPLRTTTHPFPPAKFVFNQQGRKGEAIDSIVSEGCIISGGRVMNSVLSPRVFVHSYSEVNECIIFGGVHVGRGAKLRRVIIERNVRIPENAVIGFNPEEDRKKYYVAPSGIVIVPRERAEDAYERLHPHDHNH